MNGLHRLDITLLLLFEALLAERNLTRAARRVNLAQPSASKALTRIRDLFSDPLFVRMGNGMRPTERALELAPDVSAALHQLRQLLTAEQPFDPAAAQGHLRLAMSDAAERMLLPVLMERLAVTAPGIRVQARSLDKDRAFEDLDAGRLDCAWWAFFPSVPHACWRPRCSTSASSAWCARTIPPSAAV